ncbi:MAG: hypothetical protein FJ405_15185 [Verrucomicrobia bacterium]|nr:hypothetical protein [Verrucomicrobiota bacterium]
MKPLQDTRPVQPVVSVPSTKSPVPAAVVPAPEGLVLKGITRAGRSSLALINNKTPGVGEEGKVRLGESNVTIRCISITGQSVVVHYVGSKEKIELALSGN